MSKPNNWYESTDNDNRYTGSEYIPNSIERIPKKDSSKQGKSKTKKEQNIKMLIVLAVILLLTLFTVRIKGSPKVQNIFKKPNIVKKENKSNKLGIIIKGTLILIPIGAGYVIIRGKKNR